jgi:hypothetical protein
MRFVGARHGRPLSGEELQPGRVTHVRGRNPADWRRDVPTYSRVRAAGLYPGVDLVYYGSQDKLEYDFQVAPEADAGAIRLGFEADDARSARPRLGSDGQLVVQTAAGPVIQDPPIAYQEVRGRRVTVPVRYALAGEEVGFALGDYDHHRPLVIDPVLRYFTDQSSLTSGIAVGPDGSAYVTGSGFGDFADTDVFVRKFNRDGSALVYTFTFGGEGYEQSGGIAVDSHGAAYVTGSTGSTRFPVSPGCLQSELAWTPDPEFPEDTPTTSDAFVAKINPAGNKLVYGTYLGGHALENSASWGAIAADAAGNTYVTGDTASADFPTVNAVRPDGQIDPDSFFAAEAFVVKLNPTATGAIYSTYFGGARGEVGFGIAAGADGSAYFCGGTNSPDLPTSPGAFQANQGANDWGDAFAARLSPNGDSILYCTYLGGDSSEEARAIGLDAEGNAFVTGETTSTDFPVLNAFQPSIAGPLQPWGGYLADGFVTKLDPAGGGVFSTYFGGAAEDIPLAITVDGAGNAAFTGRTNSPDLPTFLAEQPEISWFNPDLQIATVEAFVSKLQPNGAGLVYSTFVGGGLSDEGRGIAMNDAGDIFLAGNTIAGDFGYLAARSGSGQPRTPRASARAIREGQARPFVSRLRDPARGAPLLVVNTRKLAFGSVVLPQTRDLRLYLTNPGLSVLKVSIGKASGPFQLTGATGEVTLGPGETRPVPVRFTPIRRGTQSGKLKVQDLAPRRPAVQISLQGSGK